MEQRKSVLILGTRGVPAEHGGFETFAEHLALFLVARGWDVTVYCQHEGAEAAPAATSDIWRGVHRRHIGVRASGPHASLMFDWMCVRDALQFPGVCIVLGYNGAAFLPLLRLRGRKILINMDGIEWRRPKWGLAARSWLWANEWIGAWVGNRLVADHPVIAAHLATRRPRAPVTMIPYGGTKVAEAPEAEVRALGLEPGRYLISIARIEPDNNILTIVEAFSRRRRGVRLVVLGRLKDSLPYHARLRAAASDEVLFPGAIYDARIVAALRFHARAYLHGHTVGGTNPSLVEALWAGNAVIAHDNPYNRWTAGEAAMFFDGTDACDQAITRALADDAAIARAGIAARRAAEARFGWTAILEAYEREVLDLLGQGAGVPDVAEQAAEKAG
jgi:glycosyltransferase involved in cell wall biosynthesis